MHQRSQRKLHCDLSERGSPTTVISSLTLSRTNILALTPLLLRASIRRLAATAAPPAFSLVFTMSTRIANIFYDCKGKEKNVQTKEKQEKTHADCANYAVPYLFDPLNMSTENYPPTYFLKRVGEFCFSIDR